MQPWNVIFSEPLTSHFYLLVSYVANTEENYIDMEVKVGNVANFVRLRKKRMWLILLHREWIDVTPMKVIDEVRSSSQGETVHGNHPFSKNHRTYCCCTSTFLITLISKFCQKAFYDYHMMWHGRKARQSEQDVKITKGKQIRPWSTVLIEKQYGC